jgi:hypothetical protein
MSRTEDLAADAALFGLETDEAAELERLAAEDPLVSEQLELAAARLALHGMRERKLEPLPAELRAKVQARAFAHFESVIVAPPPSATTTGANIVELPPAARRRRSTTAFFFAAAACIAAGVGITTLRSTEEGARPAMAAPDALPPLVATRGPMSAELRASLSADIEVIALGLEGPNHALYLFIEDDAGQRTWILGPELVQDADGARVAKVAGSLRVVGFAIAERGLEPGERALTSATLRAVRGQPSGSNERGN